MQEYQKQFIDLAIREQVLQFGEFTLKSGRISPYFFNAGLFNTGAAVRVLAGCYAKAIIEAQLEFDVLFGPAYKGIPLVATVAMRLSELTGEDVPFAFNRKEAKTHGEGGNIVGADIKNKRLLVLDDVITAGTAIKQVIDIVSAQNAQVASVLIALDRQEKVNGDLSAIQTLETQGIKAVNIIGFDNLSEYIKNSDKFQGYGQALESYRKRYGVS